MERTGYVPQPGGVRGVKADDFRGNPNLGPSLNQMAEGFRRATVSGSKATDDVEDSHGVGWTRRRQYTGSWSIGSSVAHCGRRKDCTKLPVHVFCKDQMDFDVSTRRSRRYDSRSIGSASCRDANPESEWLLACRGGKTER